MTSEGLVITAVLDTNVLASGFVRPEPPGQLLVAWSAGLYEVVVSEHILTKLARTFEQIYFRTHLSPVPNGRSYGGLRNGLAVDPRPPSS